MPNFTRNMFGRAQQVVKAAYTSDQFEITITGGRSLQRGGGENFILVQGVEINVSQNVTRLFDLESASYMALVGSRPEGNMNIAGAITNFHQMCDFTQEYGDVCSAVGSGDGESGARNITLSITSNNSDPTSCNFEGGTLVISYPVLVSQNLAVRVQEYVIQSAMAIIFADARPDGSAAQ